MQNFNARVKTAFEQDRVNGTSFYTERGVMVESMEVSCTAAGLVYFRTICSNFRQVQKDVEDSLTASSLSRYWISWAIQEGSLLLFANSK